LKDLPTDQPDGIVIGAILERADSSDVLVSKRPGGLAGLPIGAAVATSSPRRQVQILLLRQDLRVVEIRGNIPTRLRKPHRGPVAGGGLVLAKAGLTDSASDLSPRAYTWILSRKSFPRRGRER
jgi:hydroxymethylbilane synthase